MTIEAPEPLEATEKIQSMLMIVCEESLFQFVVLSDEVVSTTSENLKNVILVLGR